ncbi:YkoF family thiamine/hydroxymethylpyrimidine-binding protein [Alteromonas ponticola]|uniref:YkoF family thiamine/hydroxymethylpyrimidine-binding protein n=1 Tax=Alteromonas aquimaris TaxID=2998417 RepID=A0ABT3P4K9_9ALTE|nr:YkoF family thiamine/hydroxymethylpyrimidine-binding protein [Alteromonas aquimaris]MCW8107696.1 YkoF family thiamine/hydroxymethylpyrimidine-binding protein [Alteromonas aquimaris]
MQVMVELSLYPLVEHYIAPIKAFIERLHNDKQISITTSRTSTQVTGDYDYVMALLTKEMKATHQQVGQAVFVAKILNFDAMQAGAKE